jgi:hypothetical protein
VLNKNRASQGVGGSPWGGSGILTPRVPSPPIAPGPVAVCGRRARPADYLKEVALARTGSHLITNKILYASKQ